MKTVEMCLVGTKNGLPIYSPIDQESLDLLDDRPVMAFELKSPKAQASMAQRRSIRLYCKWLCDAFNNAGLDMIMVLTKISKKGKIPWSPDAVLERLWRPTQAHTFGTNSTTKLDRDQVSIVHDALNQVTSEQLGVSMNFPDKYLKLYEEMSNKGGRL